MKHKNSNVDFLSKCSFCGNGFEQEDLVILEDRDQGSAFHVTCAQCNTSTIVFLSSSQSGIISAGIATDLDDREVRSKYSSNAITADEVIDMHQFISRYKGNLVEWVKDMDR